MDHGVVLLTKQAKNITYDVITTLNKVIIPGLPCRLKHFTENFLMLNSAVKHISEIYA